MNNIQNYGTIKYQPSFGRNTGRIIAKYSTQNPVIKQRGGILTNRVTTLLDRVLGTEVSVYEPGMFMRCINKLLGQNNLNVVSSKKHPSLLYRVISKVRGENAYPWSMCQAQIGKDVPTPYYEYLKVS